MVCKHAITTADPSIIKCSKNKFNGFENQNFCENCSDYEGPNRGIGDIISNITKKVGIRPCKGCQKRREKLNKLLPIKEKQK